MVDDFESYNDTDNRIYDAWIDGMTNNTGSLVGYMQAPFAEQTIIHGGKQSMPLEYNNVKTPYYSETDYAWNTAQNWTVGGADTLVLYFQGRGISFLSKSADSFTMSASGTDIWSTADQFRFAFERLSGNGTIIASVDSIVNTDPWATAGVMIRESLAVGSRFAAVCATAGNGVRYRARLLTDSAATSDTAVATAGANGSHDTRLGQDRAIGQHVQRLLLHGWRQVDGDVLEPADDRYVRRECLYRPLGVQSQCRGGDHR